MGNNRGQGQRNREQSYQQGRRESDASRFSSGMDAAGENVAADRSRLGGLYEDIPGLTPTGHWENFMQTGGVDPAAAASIRGLSGDMKGRADFLTSPEAYNQWGGETFDEFAETGGWDDTRKGQFRDRIARHTPRVFSRLQERLANQRAVQGGYAPGYSEQASQLSRDAAEESSGAVREGELGMASAVDEGRRFGATGQLQARSGLEGAALGNRSQAGGLELGLAGTEASGRLAAGSGFSNALATRAGLQSNIGQALLSAGLTEQQIAQAGYLSSMGISDEQIARMMGLDVEQSSQPGTWERILGMGISAAGSIASPKP